VTPPALATEPACLEAPKDEDRDPRPRPAVAPPLAAGSVRIEPREMASIPRTTWDRLAAATPWATPFSAWAFHRAWWDAYGDNAHEQTLVVVAANAPAVASGAVRLGPDGGLRPGPTGDDILAIVPLMHRHEVEPGDAATATRMRHGHPTGSPVRPTAKAVFFGASYHADYATILADPTDLDAAAEALVEALAAGPDPAHGDADWDVVDLRRLRHDDPALHALQAAFARRGAREGWHVAREQEDVCPVLSLPEDGDWETYLSSLDRKDRHEIRRKIRRAETAGPNTFRLVDPSTVSV